MTRRRHYQPQNHVYASRSALTRFCHRWVITRLELFGPVLTDHFHLESDIDMLATFRADTQHTLLDLVRMEGELSRVYGRQVDLGDYEAVMLDDNSLRRQDILSTLKVIYEERPSQLGGHAAIGGEDQGVSERDERGRVQPQRQDDIGDGV
ncbi:MAG: nucleotidyltransferase domain-containing protein [Chloroflexi bacterium]|nr:nucleotidyltransferase domain-containing protein [Chloroflexota bacterium]